MYFIQIIPAITFGVFLQRTTGGDYGVSEVLMATSIAGMFAAIFAGQALVIVGVTGPVSIFSSTLYIITSSFTLPFLSFMFWVGIWAAVMHFRNII